ncbi:MAG: glycosyltransferase family 2 protein [Spirochaetota bacterium]
MVSVVIPTYNRAHFLERAVQSVLSQSHAAVEVVVIDDGSEDSTPELLARMAVRHPAGILNCRRIAHSGVSRARNQGIACSRGEWICFLDSDDYWLPRKLERQLAYLSRNPGYRVCHTDEVWIRNGVRINPGRKHRKWEGWFFEPSLQLCLISPSTVMLHRSVLEEVGGFDESFPVVEDYELWLRVTARYPVGYLYEKLVVKTGGHPDQLSASIEAIEKYRLRALEKVMTSGCLSPAFFRTAREVYRKKALIYLQGCLKRGKQGEAERMRRALGRFAPEETARPPGGQDGIPPLHDEVRA